ncbi:MAG: mechanosensitive ion channel protein MscS, partial [archaeon]
SIEPSIFLKLTDNWINFSIRYISEIHQRRLLNDRLSRAILSEFEKSKNIRIASQTYTVTGSPKTLVKK